MEQSNQGLMGDVMFAVLASIIVVIVAVVFVHRVIKFKDERDYIKMEIERSGNKGERLYWKEKLKSSYIKTIPIIGELFLDDDYEDEYDIYG